MRMEEIVMRLSYAAAQGMRMAELRGVDNDSQYQVMALSMNGRGLGVQAALEKVQPSEKEEPVEQPKGFRM